MSDLAAVLPESAMREAARSLAAAAAEAGEVPIG